ncbi:restriction endonuclease subunit S [Thermodesulfovibrio yellowstonii]|uniref:Type I restriction modification DNA specificity domain-containing protein n=1 Tax=Thermodesulfovibrio yellowstonii TaxID=28262 RepID=A0A9W6LJZ6_9BACT|nr:restriction endonuclease subunit S [Thermodesulfovibrio islandicus]GLI52310.1 hypothetical protein TISLANDTSLP1_00030 [Thermodesulfovibrio islandicus]
MIIQGWVKIREKNGSFFMKIFRSVEHLGKVAFIDSDISYYAGGFMGILRVKETNSVLPKYLYEILNSDTYRNIVRRTGSGANIKNLSSTIFEIKIPVPPPDAQARIVAECQAIDAEVEQAEKEILDSQRIAREKVQACFSQGQVVTLSDLVFINRQSIDPTKFPDKDFIYVDISNVEKETGIIDYSQVIKGKNAPSRARRIAPKGSVIISTVRPNLKGFAFVERDTQDCVFSTGFAVLESRDESVIKNKALFYAFLYLDDLMDQMVKAMGKAAYPSINQSDIESLQIHVPDAQAQEELLKELSSIESRLQSARAVIASAPARRRAVLEKYIFLENNLDVQPMED